MKALVYTKHYKALWCAVHVGPDVSVSWYSTLYWRAVTWFIEGVVAWSTTKGQLITEATPVSRSLV